jgi:hypothetical protein
VIAAEGLPRLWRRPGAERGGVAREIQPRAEAAGFAALPERAETRLAGLLLAVPDLIALGIPDMITAAGYPSTPKIPALSYVLSLLALKLAATRRVSHVYDIAADPGAALFAALTALPKATALTTYSYRLEHSRQAAFGPATRGHGGATQAPVLAAAGPTAPGCGRHRLCAPFQGLFTRMVAVSSRSRTELARG